jgi:hypothetical protein
LVENLFDEIFYSSDRLYKIDNIETKYNKNEELQVTKKIKLTDGDNKINNEGDLGNNELKDKLLNYFIILDSK